MLGPVQFNAGAILEKPLQHSTLKHALCAVAVFLTPIAAQAETTSYTCKFTLQATPKGLTQQAKPFELRFLVDKGTEKAYLLGNAGSSEVEIIPNRDGISFIEITGTGNVMVTAVTSSGSAVHSRNGIMSKELVPSQFYGSCVLQ